MLQRQKSFDQAGQSFFVKKEESCEILCAGAQAQRLDPNMQTYNRVFYQEF
jgi:hypothetical protein